MPYLSNRTQPQASILIEKYQLELNKADVEHEDEDAKMITILSLAVGYCISMTAVCGRFAFDI